MPHTHTHTQSHTHTSALCSCRGKAPSRNADQPSRASGAHRQDQPVSSAQRWDQSSNSSQEMETLIRRLHPGASDPRGGPETNRVKVHGQTSRIPETQSPSEPGPAPRRGSVLQPTAEFCRSSVNGGDWLFPSEGFDGFNSPDFSHAWNLLCIPRFCPVDLRGDPKPERRLCLPAPTTTEEILLIREADA